MCPWKFLTLRTVAVVQGLLSKQRSFPFLTITWLYNGNVFVFSIELKKRPCTTATVPEVSHFQWHIFLSYRCTTYRWTVLGPTVVWSYYGKKIKWPRFWLWKKKPCTTAIVPEVIHFQGHVFLSYRRTTYDHTTERCLMPWLWKKALYNGNSAQGQPFSRAPSYTIFKGHRFEGRHWRRQRWRSRWLSSTQGRPPLPTAAAS